MLMAHGIMRVYCVARTFIALMSRRRVAIRPLFSDEKKKKLNEKNLHLFAADPGTINTD